MYLGDEEMCTPVLVTAESVSCWPSVSWCGRRCLVTCPGYHGPNQSHLLQPWVRNGTAFPSYQREGLKCTIEFSVFSKGNDIRVGNDPYAFGHPSLTLVSFTTLFSPLILSVLRFQKCWQNAIEQSQSKPSYRDLTGWRRTH